MSIYSAAIIGASPAGCIAAIALACKGFKVLLIDPSEFPGDLPLEGRSLKERQRQRHRADLSSPLDIECSAWPGCRTWRSLCNQSLRTVAQALGVEVWKACRVDTAIIEQGQLMGLTTECGTVRAYHILDASGQRQWLSRQLGIPTKPPSPQSSPNQSSPNQSSSKLMARFNHLTWQMRDRFAGPGWFLLGDAAASPDPAISYGLLRALTYGLFHVLQSAMSALYAARAIADCEHGKISEALAAQSYSQWLQTWFIQSSVTQHSREYTTHYSPAFPMCF
ncbi:MAG: NAD(P)/FAD-dependent oxidoreductase [Phormidesmis sp.]